MNRPETKVEGKDTPLDGEDIYGFLHEQFRAHVTSVSDGKCRCLRCKSEWVKGTPEKHTNQCSVRRLSRYWDEYSNRDEVESQFYDLLDCLFEYILPDRVSF